MHVARRARVVQAQGEPGGGQPAPRGEREEDVQAHLPLADQHEVGGEERGELARQHRGHAEAEAAGGGEGGQVTLPPMCIGVLIPTRGVVTERPAAAGRDLLDRGLSVRPS